MRLSRVRVAMVVAAVCLVGCDHGSKMIAKDALEHRAPHTLLGGVIDLDYAENRDTGFGLLHAVPEPVRRPILTAVQLLSGVVFLFIGLGRRARPFVRWCLLLVSAGAVGNGLDRLVRGYVVDFVYVHHWPVFNLADIYITVGAALLLIAAHSGQRQPTRGEGELGS